MTPIHLFRQLTAGFLLTALLMTGGIVMPETSSASAKSPHAQNPQKVQLKFKQGEVLVKFKKTVTDSAADNIANKKHLKKKEKFKQQQLSLFQSDTGESTEQMIANLKQDPNVEYVEPNYIRTIQADPVTPNDLHMKDMWNMSILHSSEAWAKTTGSKNVVVAVLDTGILFQHADLKENLWDGSLSAGGCKDQYGLVIPAGCPNHGWDVYYNDNKPTDDHGHGSHVSSTIGALVTLRDEEGDGLDRYFLIPGGSGTGINVGGESYKCISTITPLGQALLNKQVGDEVILTQGVRERVFEVVTLE